jgi:hypothetical protein
VLKYTSYAQVIAVNKEALNKGIMMIASSIAGRLIGDV